MKRRRLYGWPAPVNFGMYATLGIFLVAALLALQLTQAALFLVWGSPPGPPIVALRWTRSPLLVCALLLTLALVRSRQMAMVICPAILACVLLSVAPLHSPHYVVIALARGLRLHNASDLAVLTCGLTIGAGISAWLARGLGRAFRLSTTAVRGSTEWGAGQALKMPEQGLLLGSYGKEMLRYDGDGHLMTIAATRSGKGVGTIVPNLLSWPGPIVVTDPKGENFYITARWREEQLGHEVVALDPFGLTDSIRLTSWSFNPLDLINVSGDDYVETAMMMADMLVMRRSTARDPFWETEAKALLFTCILHVVANEDPERRTLVEVRRLLTSSPEHLGKVLEEMNESPIPQVREGAGRILQKADRERSAVFSTAQSHTHVLSSPRMEEMLSRTNFDLKQLPLGGLSIYLILPREHFGAFAPWLRLMVSCCYHACTHDALHRPKSPYRVVFLLDEFANLGYMDNIKEAVSLGGGYGLSLWLILQDIAQLRREYRDEWESFVANSDIIQVFAIQDTYTCENVAKLLGEKTVWHRRVRKANRREGGRLVKDFGEESRPLLRAEELRRLHPERQIILARPYQPVVANKLVYYRDRFFSGRFDPNPYVTPTHLPA